MMIIFYIIVETAISYNCCMKVVLAISIVIKCFTDLLLNLCSVNTAAIENITLMAMTRVDDHLPVSGDSIFYKLKVIRAMPPQICKSETDIRARAQKTCYHSIYL